MLRLPAVFSEWVLCSEFLSKFFCNEGKLQWAFKVNLGQKKKCSKYNKDRPDALPLGGQTSEQFVVYCMELDIVADLHSRLQETQA